MLQSLSLDRQIQGVHPSTVSLLTLEPYIVQRLGGAVAALVDCTRLGSEAGETR